MRYALAFAVLAASASSAGAATPQGARLSEIIVKIEQTPNFDYIDEIEWKDRGGYYGVEYYLKDGAKVEVRIDPKTGAQIK